MRYFAAPLAQAMLSGGIMAAAAWATALLAEAATAVLGSRADAMWLLPVAFAMFGVLQVTPLPPLVVCTWCVWLLSCHRRLGMIQGSISTCRVHSSSPQSCIFVQQGLNLLSKPCMAAESTL